MKNSNSISEPDHKKTYLLTTDIPEMMGAYERNGLQISPPDFFQGIQKRLVQKLEECLPRCNMEVISFDELVTQIGVVLNRFRDPDRKSVIVSPVAGIIEKLGGPGHCIQINRIVNLKGEFLGTGVQVGTRPGYDLLYDQFRALKSLLKGRPVILIDDGSFTGHTIVTMIELCEDIGIEVERIVVGFLFTEAKYFILQAFQKERVHSWKEDSFLDWLPDHDFLPFVPNCGRVVGQTFEGQSRPTYVNGLSLCVPYILPYGGKEYHNPHKWASIQIEKEVDFSAFCLNETISIFKEMERINNAKLTLESLLKTYPRVHIPVKPELGVGFPSTDTRIIDILHRDLKELS